jgi:hypothetical protein
MVDRDKRVVVDIPEDWVIDLDEKAEFAGKTRADVLREAIREYLDRDRMNRIEDDIADIKAQLSGLEGVPPSAQDSGTHTHKRGDGMNQASPSVEKAREMVRTLQSRHDAPVIQAEDVERAIEDIAGADDRTLRKYKRIFRDRGLLFAHPGANRPVWTFEGDQWLTWIEQFATLEGTDAAEEIADQYGPVTVKPGAKLRIELAEDTE